MAQTRDTGPGARGFSVNGWVVALVAIVVLALLAAFNPAAGEAVVSWGLGIIQATGEAIR